MHERPTGGTRSFGVKVEPIDEAIERFEGAREAYYASLPSEDVRETARIIDANQERVRVPQRVVVTLFSREYELTRTRELTQGF